MPTVHIDDLNNKQYDIFRSIVDTKPSVTKYHVLRASRQSGKTFLLLRIAIQFSFQKTNQVGAMISASFSQFSKLWRELISIVPEGLIRGTDKSSNIIYFVNGSSLQFFTAKNYDAIVGNTFDFLLADEVALYPKNALGFITPVLDAKRQSKALFVSTPRGKNEFYHYCMRGMDNNNTFVEHYRMSYLDNPSFDLRVIEEKRNTLPDAIFKSEYLAEFVFGQSSVFGNFSKYQTVDSFEEPKLNETYYGGLDISGTGEDSTILTILDSKGKPVLIYEAESTALPDQANELIPIINKYNNANVKVECNGLGIGLAEILELHCDNIYKFYNSNSIKNKLVLKFKENLYNKTLALPTIDLYPKLDNEMSTYMVKQTSIGLTTFEHANGFHDDALDSIMMANLLKDELLNGSEISTVSNIIQIKDTIVPTARDYRDYLKDYY